MRKISYPDPKIGATILALISFLAVPCFSAPGPVSEPTFEVTVEENLMIPMRDGTRLAADIYKPVGAGPVPIILQRTPYNKLGRAVVKLAHDYASRGYVVVLQDTRGRFASEGEFRNYLDDGWGKRQDGYDTIEWLAKQPWSNGKTGTFGNSYPGTIQYLTAVTRPPHLTAMFVSNAAADFYQEVRYHGGAFMGHAVRWQVSNQAFTRRVSTSEDWGMLLEASPRKRHSAWTLSLVQPFWNGSTIPQTVPSGGRWVLIESSMKLRCPLIITEVGLIVSGVASPRALPEFLPRAAAKQAAGCKNSLWDPGLTVPRVCRR